MHDRKWQYKVETLKSGLFKTTEKADAEINERLNRLGMEGWELVSVAHDGASSRAYFKK